MPTIINIADLKDPDDPQGRTYRQINNAKQHAIPVGALVEIADPQYPGKMDGARLFVVMHTRDCDGTPLYELCANPEDTTQENPRFRNAKWHGGYSEDSLTVIRLPSGTKGTNFMTTGEIKPTDWKLWTCAPETGRESLKEWGREPEMRAELKLLADSGRDAWLIAPDGTKVLPGGQQEAPAQPPLVLHRAANHAARAVVAIIEEQTGEEVSHYNSMRLVNVLGAALERNGFDGGPSGEIRAVLERSYDASRQTLTDADGEPITVGQELFNSYHDPVRVVSFTPEGVEVEPIDKSEPSEVVEPSCLSRQRFR